MHEYDDDGDDDDEGDNDDDDGADDDDVDNDDDYDDGDGDEIPLPKNWYHAIRPQSSRTYKVYFGARYFNSN